MLERIFNYFIIGPVPYTVHTRSPRHLLVTLESCALRLTCQSPVLSAVHVNFVRFLLYATRFWHVLLYTPITVP